MGYECPVCDAEEADGEHLANHVAFTAMLRGGDHEAWLDDHVPDWADRDPDSLAPDVVEHAAETDTEASSIPHEHDHEGFDTPQAQRAQGGADLSGDAAEVLEEARELTREMYRADEEGESADGADESDSESE